MGSDYKNDLDLAARVAQGDADAFNDFYARHADLVFAFIYHLLNGARADAEEIWQDTFVAALRALPGYRGQSQLSSWLCGIARRKVADFHRRRGGTREPVSSVPPEQLLDLMDSGVITGKIAKTVFEEMFNTGNAPGQVVEEAGLTQIAASDELAAVVEKVVAENPKAVRDYQAGKEEALRFLVGQVMRETRGRANPGLVHELLGKKLGAGG